MQKIDGIDLAELVTETENDILAEKRAAVRKQVSGIVLNLAQWREGKKRAEKEVEKYQQKITKAEDKLKAIREGNWSVLEDQQQGKEKAQTGQKSEDADD